MPNPNPPSPAALALLAQLKGGGVTTTKTTTGGGSRPASASASKPPSAAAEALLQSFLNPAPAAPAASGPGPIFPAISARPVSGKPPSAAAEALLQLFTGGQPASGVPGAMDLSTYSAPGSGLLNPSIIPSGVAQGIDIAQVNETWNPLAAQRPENFAIFKVSEGLAPYDFSKFYASAQEAGTPILGAYHFIRPDVSTSGQVNNFLSQVAGKNFSFYAVDLENSPISGPVTKNLASQARSFIQTVSQTTGKPVLLYTNESTLGQFFNKPGDVNIPVWLAASTTQRFSQAQPLPGRNVVLYQSPVLAPALQYGTQTNPRPSTFASQGVDINRALGSVGDLVNQLQQVAQFQTSLYGR